MTMMNAYLNSKLNLLPSYDQAEVRKAPSNWEKYLKLKEALTVFNENQRAASNES